MSNQQSDTYNNFYYDGQNFGTGVHYTALDYVPVSKFTPLSGTHWWRVDNITQTPTIGKYTVDLNVGCSECGVSPSNQNKVMRIEVISYDRNIFRIRFDPYATSFSDYDNKENTFGPITRAQLNWIQSQDSAAPQFNVDGNNTITITLKDVVMTFYKSCWMEVKSRSTGQLLHSDGWVTPPGNGYINQPQGIIFVDQAYGSACAAIKNLPTEPGSSQKAVRYYGCGECQDYYATGDAKGNHSSHLEHTGQTMTFFNYDNYEMDAYEVRPSTSSPGTEESYIPEYVTAPFMVEYAKDCSYAYGLLLDNTSQTYFNFASTEYPGTFNPGNTKNIDNVYYLGSQYQGLDYYLIFSEQDAVNEGAGVIQSVLNNFTLLTGKENENADQLNLRGAMPPKYIFGFFQGVFGFSGLNVGNWSVESVVNGYRNNNIPLEGLAIDVDVQNNFEVFTTNGNFWDSGTVGQGKSVFEWANDNQLVCQTNITNFIRSGQSGYDVYDSLVSSQLYVVRSRFIDYPNGPGPSDGYVGMLPYADNCFAIFPDYGDYNAAGWWGKNYWNASQAPNPLLKIGLNFVWQDMTVPAMNPHLLTNPCDNSNFNGTPGNSDLTSGIFNWKTFHGQQLYTDPRYQSQSLPYISMRNLHAYMECKATYQQGLTVPGQLPLRYNRSYIISRGGYIGMAQYAGFWTGDDASGWNYLQEEVPKALNMGICGFPIVGADVGGFAPTGEDDYNHCQEYLMTRWVQAASLLPWYRDHYVNFNHGGKAFQEIYKFDWPYDGRKFSDIMNDFIKMRVRWHHVLYNSMYQFVKTGMPLVKPTPLYEGGSNNSDMMTGFEDCQDSMYFIGNSDIMVAPALEDENCAATGKFPTTIENHPIWFPKNQKWFPYSAQYDSPCDPGNEFNPTLGSFGYYEGDGNSHGFTVPLEIMPVFIKEGAIIPTRMTKDGSSKNIQQLDIDDEPFIFDIWPGSENSQLECYFDDGGVTLDAESKGVYSLLTIAQSTTTVANKWTVDFKSEYYQYTLTDYMYLRLRGSMSGTVTDSQGNAYSQVNSLTNLYNSTGPAWYFDSTNLEEWIKFPTKSITKAGDTFQVIKDNSSVYTPKPLSF